MRKDRYNLSPVDWDGLLRAFDGQCWICRKVEATQVDHDHACCDAKDTCGECFRGALCAKCNVGLGFLEKRGTWSLHLEAHRENVEDYLGVI